MSNDGRTVGSAVFRPASEEDRQLSGLVDYDGLWLDIDSDAFDLRAQVVIRPGTCKRVIAGPTYRIGGWPTIDVRLSGDWVVEVYGRPGAIRPMACGANGGQPGEAFSLESQSVEADGRAERATDGRLEMKLGQGQAVIQPLADGRRTEIFVRHESLADYTDLPVHLRAGTCSRYTASRLIPLAPLVPDDELHEDTGVSVWSESTTQVELPFEQLVRGPYALEVHDRDTAEFSGAGIESCAEIGG